MNLFIFSLKRIHLSALYRQFRLTGKTPVLVTLQAECPLNQSIIKVEFLNPEMKKFTVSDEKKITREDNDF